MYARLKSGEIIVEPSQSTSAVPGGMIHHWRGIVFIPGANLNRTLLFLQNYNEQYKYYWPEVQKSKLLRRNAGHFDVWLRLKRTKVVTVFLDAQFSIDYTSLDETHALSRSHSTQILEVENAGSFNERRRPEGNDNGYLWRLNSYWRLQERDGGVYVQLEAVSLTRAIPDG
ncbi:MAG: hypothetical protein JOY93_10160, partial [Acidobacteriales bacterium]|nr:hypothetical protein [Terriglobales bacterium]